MTTRTIRDNAAAAGFAFIASALVCGAVLVASTSMAPAQTLVLPSNGTSNTAQDATGMKMGHYLYDLTTRGTPQTQSPTSANVSGVPGQTNTTTSTTSTLRK